MASAEAERYWDARAREHALFYVDNRIDYRRPDVAAFWAAGEETLDALLGPLGVAVGPSDAVLDLGCGVGRLTRVLAARAAAVVAVDVSAEMLARAAELNPGLENVTWLHGDGRGLAGIGDGELDAAVSHVVFQHVPEPDVVLAYVRELGRVLRQGGWAAFTVSTDPAIHRPGGPARRVAWRLAAVRRRGPRAQEHPAWLGAPVSLEALERAAGEGGLALERVLGAGTQFTSVLARRR